ncbi:putative Na+/H+ antiporter [Aromatoleum buckelii]|uniref:putative Na+/H+ antiporter n=1 Tax=Aromatoleum buckelii TaxID=200254 RepID=UPI001B7D1FC0
MNAPTLIQFVATALFAVAILHTFSTRIFERLAHTRPTHAGIWHLLGEIEVVFGFWALILVLLRRREVRRHGGELSPSWRSDEDETRRTKTGSRDAGNDS